jgi:hypothetical protein
MIEDRPAPKPEDSKPRTVRDETYAAQREELVQLLTARVRTNEILRTQGGMVLTSDEMGIILMKIKNDHPFSRKERAALTEAGFNLQWLYPDL